MSFSRPLAGRQRAMLLRSDKKSLRVLTGDNIHIPPYKYYSVKIGVRQLR